MTVSAVVMSEKRSQKHQTRIIVNTADHMVSHHFGENKG